MLSILTPAIPERAGQLGRLLARVQAQCIPYPASVEHVVLIDPRGHRTVGEKRDALLRLARGDFVAFVDDDDDIADDYVASLVEAISSIVADGLDTDVVTFRQRAVWCGRESEVRFGLRAKNGPFLPDGVTQRAAWHVCAWRRTLAQRFSYPPENYGEDWAWAMHANAVARTEVHIPRVLHAYIHDPAATAAPPPKS